jgi:hypothetical protein
MDEPSFPIMMNCPARNRPVEIGVSATRGDFKTRHFTTKSRIDCPACGGIHVVEQADLVLGDTPD